VASARLDPVLREIAGVAVGVAVDNRYGVAFHSTMLARLGLPEDQVRLLREGGAPAGQGAAAVAALAREIVLNRGRVSASALDGARQAGLSTEAILEVLLECAFATLVGLIDNLAGHVELDAFIAPQAW
jgi:alkylhydroperoxidase family enzyme